MLFNAPEFLLAFLPAVLAGFFVLGAIGRSRWAILWLITASLFFYGWWRIDFLPLLVGSVVFNYGIGVVLARRPSRWLLGFGIAANLGALGWFKYSGFLATAINDLAGAGLPVPQVVLPLAISFYTFQQIAYLVDAYAGETRETNFSRYALFVVFFPQLIAGPIVHHKEMLSQFDNPETYRPRLTNLTLGLTAFSIGLFKKVFIADPLAWVAHLAFGPAADGTAPYFADAWLGAIAFSLQLYFDFSGYSDMAIGLGLMFGIRLPINFASPFKSASIIEFWTRWHMTLTRFLTSYVYNPLSMALTRRRMRAGKPMLNPSKPAFGPFVILLTIPTLFTMTLAGIWHGAGWQFVVFGAMHGVMLVANHAWRAGRRATGLTGSFGWPGRVAGVAVTFLAVTVSLVFFKAVSMDHAMTVIRGMVGLGGEMHIVRRVGEVDPATLGPIGMMVWRLSSLQGMLFLGALAIIWLLPNTPRYIESISQTVEDRIETARQVFGWTYLQGHWRSLIQARPSFVQGAAVGMLLSLALLRALSVAPSEFLYFTF